MHDSATAHLWKQDKRSGPAALRLAKLATKRFIQHIAAQENERAPREFFVPRETESREGKVRRERIHQEQGLDDVLHTLVHIPLVHDVPEAVVHTATGEMEPPGS